MQHQSQSVSKKIGTKTNKNPFKIQTNVLQLQDVLYFYTYKQFQSAMLQFYIETERLIMRDLLPEDADGMFALDSDAEVHRYLGNKPVQSIEQSREVIEIIRAQYVSNGIGRWAVIEKDSGAFVGWSGIKLMTISVNGYCNYYDLGYRFIKQFWGKGYATETALASVRYAWDVLKAEELYGMADTANSASRNVLEKVGMRFSATFEYDGVEHAWYKLLKNEAGLEQKGTRFALIQ